MTTNTDNSISGNQCNHENIWRTLMNQVHPFTVVLCIEGEVFRQFDAGTKHFIAKKFMKHVQESVLYVFDGTGPDRVYLGAPRHFLVQGGMILRIPGGGDCYWTRRTIPKVITATVLAPPQPPKDIKIPRPPNAYILYRKERHQLVKDTNPGITNNEISQILGKAWNSESFEVRQRYKSMSEDIKQALMEKHPDYQYRPRRPCERRRRRRNIAGQAQSGHNASGNGSGAPGVDAITIAAAPGGATTA